MTKIILNILLKNIIMAIILIAKNVALYKDPYIYFDILCIWQMSFSKATTLYCIYIYMCNP